MSIKRYLMTEQCSVNSACLNHLGQRVISDPEEVAEFEKNLRNPMMSDETKKFYRDSANTIKIIMSEMERN